jgi:hypothetical protein
MNLQSKCHISEKIQYKKTMNKHKYLPLIVAAGFIASLAAVVPVFAAMQTGQNWQSSRSGGARNGMMPGVAGNVTAISGTTLTVTRKTRPNATSTAATVYTVDASNAQIVKDGATSTIASIATGDTVMVQGTVTGTDVAATVIRDGVSEKNGTAGNESKTPHRNATSTPSASLIQGNGEPIVAGSITTISGTTVTITNASNVTYAIDASNAKIIKNGTSTGISDIATGDNIIVQGTVNGTSVVASSLMDQGAGKQNGAHAATSTSTVQTSHFDIFGALGTIGNFFKHLFGF